MKKEQQEKINISAVWRYYWPHMKKYPKSGLFLMVFYALGTLGAHVFLPLIYKEIVDVITEASDRASVADALFGLVALLGGLIVVFNIMYRIGDYTISYFQSNILREISNATFTKLQKHSYNFFANNFAGALVTKAKRFNAAFETIHDKFIFDFYFGFIKITGAVVILLWLAPLIAILLLCWLVFYCIVTVTFIKYKIPRDLAESHADSKMTAALADTITNVLNVKMFGHKKYEYNRFARVTTYEEQKRRSAWYFGNFMNIVQGFLFGILEFSVVFFVVKAWLAGTMSVGTILVIQAYLISTFDSVWVLGRALIEGAKALADAKEMVDIFETPTDITDPQSPQKNKIKDGRIVFDNVSFAYGEGNDVFSNFSLTIAPAEKIGLVGHSGAGKTTITKLLLRFADVDGGAITIDNQDIRTITQDDLRRSISYVPQEPLLFHRSLRENIAYGKTDASDEEIIAVAGKAHAHEFIMRLPHGYDTLVGERGIKLSGGERQRIAIARAMLKDTPILVLDEATSSLDSVSERHIQQALAVLMQGRTTIVIAHRLSTVQKMNRIIVLDDGKIAEEGTHKELLTKKNLYYTFYQEQAGGFLPE